MAGDKDSGGVWPTVTEFFRSFGFAGTIAAAGVIIMGLALYKGPDFKDANTQNIGVIGGFVIGLIVFGFGAWQLRRNPAMGGNGGKRGSAKYAVFIAAPMAGFGDDAAGRKAGTEFVGSVRTALQKLLPDQFIYAAPLERTDPTVFETPATAFDKEREALHASERYVLVIPPVFPAGTSVLMTVGMAIGLDLRGLVLAPEGTKLPYLLEGADGSKSVKLHVVRYTDLASVRNIFDNNGIKIFGGEDA